MHGYVFGKLGDKYITKPEERDGHILVIGGAGSGKTSCIAIPSLLSWESPVFCIDIKGELYQKTAKERHSAKVFSPLDSSAFGYNPFYLLRETGDQAQEAEAIAITLVPLPPNEPDAFWIQSAQNLLAGAILHYFNLGYSFIDTIKTIQSTPVKMLITDIYKNASTEDARLYINAFVETEDKILAGVYTELSRHIMIFATDKNIKQCLTQSRIITPEDLEFGDDIFINIPEHLLRQWKNLLALIVSQFLRHFERRVDMTEAPVLFMLDEFARLGKIEGITDGLATLRSKKITISIITQSLAQLDAIYSEHQRRIIVDNCQYRAVLNATDADSQEYFSRNVGTHDKIRVSEDMRFEPVTGFVAGRGTSKTTEEKRKIKPEDFAVLNKIALFTPFGFFRVEKVPYYKN